MTKGKAVSGPRGPSGGGNTIEPGEASDGQRPRQASRRAPAGQAGQRGRDAGSSPGPREGSAAGADAALIAPGWEEAVARIATPFAAGGKARPRVLVLVDLGAARVDDPAYLPPASVEQVIDLLQDRLDATVDLAAGGDETQVWAGNRDVHALADLLGYRFETDGGHPYDIVDLGENLVDGGFPEGSALHGSALNNDWLQADLRLVLVRMRADPAEGFSGALNALIGCLPRPDKSLHYRRRRDSAEVVADLLARCPPHGCLLAIGDPASAGPADAPAAVVAAASLLLADHVAALKVGLDPFASPLLAAVAERRPLPAAPRIEGSLAVVPALPPPDPLRQAAALARRVHESGDRLLSGWLRGLDPALFPPVRPLDARAGALAAALLGPHAGGEAGASDPKASPSGAALATAADLALAAAGRASRAWRTLFSKDSFHRRAVSLGFDPGDIPPAAFRVMVAEWEALLPLAVAAPRRGPGLRWRKHEGAVLFHYSRAAPIPFDLFVERVDIARTIAAMNDYLGGTVVVLERDRRGRPVRQAERNLYLPQPNWVALFGGEPIDVGKIEVVRYRPGEHRLTWKTLHSANGSASADDGVAIFAREGDGTRVTIAGKQRFTLPPALRVVDLALLPALEAPLVSDAYQRFFDRTFSNFEALVEGREIKMGGAPDEDAEHPSAAIEAWLERAAEQLAPWLERLKPFAALAGVRADHAGVEGGGQAPRPQPDERGFVHVVPQR